VLFLFNQPAVGEDGVVLLRGQVEAQGRAHLRQVDARQPEM
jgi:hypothetical protein